MQKDFVAFDRHTLTITIQFEGKPPLIIGKHDVIISHFSTGHGGQNVNKHMNGVRLIYKIPATYQRMAVKTQEIVVRAHHQRKMEQNLHEAFHFLALKLHDYFYIPPVRRQTMLPFHEREKRLSDKKLRSLKKKNRHATDLI